MKALFEKIGAGACKRESHVKRKERPSLPGEQRGRDEGVSSFLRASAGQTDWEGVFSLLARGAAANDADPVSGETLLMRAAAENRVACMQQLVTFFADPEAKDKKGESAAFYAARSCSFAAFRVLCDLGLDPLEENGAGDPLFHCLVEEASRGMYGPKAFAALLGSLSFMIRAAVGGGSNRTVFLNRADKRMRSPLHRAMGGGVWAPKIVRFLVRTGVKTKAEDEDKTTSLMLAAEGGFYPVVRQLLALKADSRAVDRAGESALSRAVAVEERTESDLMRTVFAFLRGGHDIDAEFHGGKHCVTLAREAGHALTARLMQREWVRQRINSRKITPELVNENQVFRASYVTYAVERMAPDLLEALLDVGGDPNCGGLIKKESPLHSAVQQKFERRIFEILLAHPSIQADSLNGNGHTPLMCSIIKNNQEAFDLLLASDKVDPAFVSGRGDTALSIACACREHLFIQKLIKKGVDPNQRIDARGNTIAHGLVSNYLAMRHLKENGGDLDRQNALGVTPLMWLCMRGSQNKVTEFALINLLSYGVKVDLQDRHGDTALMFAVRRGMDSFASLLLQADADPYKPNAKGITPYEVAKKLKRESCLQEMEAARFIRRAGRSGSAPLSVPRVW